MKETSIDEQTKEAKSEEQAFNDQFLNRLARLLSSSHYLFSLFHDTLGGGRVPNSTA
jgi:uncharacterized membrane protein